MEYFKILSRIGYKDANNFDLIVKGVLIGRDKNNLILIRRSEIIMRYW